MYNVEPASPVRCPLHGSAYYFAYNDMVHGTCPQALSYAQPCAGHSKYQLRFSHCVPSATFNDRGRYPVLSISLRLHVCEIKFIIWGSRYEKIWSLWSPTVLRWLDLPAYKYSPQMVRYWNKHGRSAAVVPRFDFFRSRILPLLDRFPGAGCVTGLPCLHGS